MLMVVAPDGTVRSIYDEAIELETIGQATITRASHVEPAPGGGWTADMGLCGGPVLGPFPRRSDALAAEVRWLAERLASLDI